MNLNKKLSDILDPNKIEVVKNPIEKAHGLPNECYLNNDYLEFEKEKIFKNNWTMIGVASSVPNPGDAKPFNLLGIPILIVRNNENKVKVFHNVCSHRGFKLVDQECKLKNVIRCPYHSWSYDFNGKLTVTPHIGGLGKHEIEGFNKNNSNLKEIKSNIWMDLIFININSNAKPFEDFIKPLEDRWSKFISKKDQKLIRHSSDNGYFNMTVNSNWKFAIENYCESYHLPWIHPELNKVSNISDHYHIEDENLNFSGQGSNKYSQQFDGNIKFKCFPNWPTELSEKSEYVSLYPNVMLGIHIDHFYAFWLEPISNNQTKEHFELYYVGDESAMGGRNSKMGEYLGKGYTFKQAKKKFMKNDTVEGADLAIEIAPFIFKKINKRKIPLMFSLLIAIVKNKKLKINY